MNDELGFVIVKGDKHNMNHDDETISIWKLSLLNLKYVCKFTNLEEGRL